MPESPYDIRLEDVNIPERVRPNTNIVVSATVRNKETNIPGPLIGNEPARCDNPSDPFKEGLKVRVAVLVGGERVTANARCVGVLGGTRDYSLTWPTPGPGEYNVTVRAENAENGNLIGETSKTVTIEQNAPEQPSDDNGILPGDGGGPGGSGGSGVGALNWVQNNPSQVIVAVVIVVLLVVLAPYIVSLINYSAATTGAAA